jgi:hypothetical protein
MKKSLQFKSEELKLREKFYKDELRYHLRWEKRGQKSKSSTKSVERCQTSNNNKAGKSSAEKRTKSVAAATVPVGVLTVRNTHTPTLNRREKLSMLNITSKIMSASVS